MLLVLRMDIKKPGEHVKYGSRDVLQTGGKDMITSK